MSQNWAGNGWGGMEVLVELLEGDPDKPLVTGRVYNGTEIKLKANKIDMN